MFLGGVSVYISLDITGYPVTNVYVGELLESEEIWVTLYFREQMLAINT